MAAPDQPEDSDILKGALMNHVNGMAAATAALASYERYDKKLIIYFR